MRFWTNGGFFSSVKGHVIKWWQLVIMPVLHINNDKRAMGNVAQQQPLPVQQPTKETMSAMANEVVSQPVQNVSQSVHNSSQLTQSAPQMKSETKVVDTQDLVQENTSGENASGEDPMEILRRINEEKEEQRRQDVEKARKKAQEEARIAAIMNANKVDVDAFIEAGKAAKEEMASKKTEDDALRRAQEIMDRLNQEAAEDEAKKQAEIEAAKQEARKQFG